MRARYWLPLRLRSLLGRRRLDREMEEELAFHLEQLTRQHERRGLPRAEAVLAARREFGQLEPLKEVCRDMRRVRPLEDFVKDLAFAFRLLRRTPLVTAVAVASLALGVGASTGIFSLLHAVLLRALPVPAPGELYVGEIHQPAGVSPRFSYPVFEQARDALAGTARLAAMTPLSGLRVVAGGEGGEGAPEGALGQLVSGEFFDLLGQRAQLGRLLGPEDNRTLDGHPLVVLSDGFWSRRFDRSPAVVGRPISINGVAFTVVGVAGPGFAGAHADERPDLWLPLLMQPALRYASNASSENARSEEPWPPQPTMMWLTVLARIEDSRAVTRVAETLTLALRDQLAHAPANAEDPELVASLPAYRVQLRPAARGISRARQELATPLVVLWAMVGLLLAIACVNVASLLLARATVRRREIGIRASLGAGRGRLIRQLLAESLLIALAGAAGGLLVARGTAAGLLWLLPGSLARSTDAGLHGATLAYALALALLTGLAFGLAPALFASRARPGESLGVRAPLGAGATPRRRALAWDRLMVAGQMALSLLLLVVAGLFARSFRELVAVDLGLDRDHLVVVRMDPASSGYRAADVEALRERAASLPGIDQASLSAYGTLSGSQRTSSFALEGFTPAEGERLVLAEEFVSREYFRALGLELVAGRLFEPDDFAAGRPVSIINATMARALFAGRDPVGRHWDYDDPASPGASEIVGVVSDVRHFGLRDPVPFMAYAPARGEILGAMSSLELRTSRDPASLVPAVRDFLRRSEPRLLVTDVATFDERVGRRVRRERAVASLTGAFGTLALVLAAVGLYGTISFAVARRTGEIGVRLALGADHGSVLGLVMGEALARVGLGVAAGLPLAWLAGRGVRSLLYGVQPADPWAWAGGLAVLVTVGALAALGPAVRAARIDPLLALRRE